MDEARCHIGLHVRWPDPESWVDKFCALANSWLNTPWRGDANAEFDNIAFRLYVGDEFCAHRLPSIGELQSLAGYAKARQWGLTLLTPPLTDQGIKDHWPLFEFMSRWQGKGEAVLNDWGVLNQLNKRMPQLPLSLGRLLNKGFKDPRLCLDDAKDRISPEAWELLNTCSYMQKHTAALAKELNVKRMEVDLAPQQAGFTDLPLAASVYFPYGYVSTGRVCWLASYERKGPRRFAPSTDCARHCLQVRLSLNDKNSPNPLLYFGNAVFYQYSDEAMTSLFQSAGEGSFRLVFQGMAMGTS